MYSQLGQDDWVLRKFRGPGFFVEIGAGDGLHISNTLALERVGWHGVCVEPRPEAEKRFRAVRRCLLDVRCITAKTGDIVDFAVTKGDQDFSGIVGSFADRHRRVVAYVIKKETISINDLLDRYGAPPVIDYLSVDTEGNELEILESLDFKRYAIRLLSVEHNAVAPKREKIHALLCKHGLERDFAGGFDDWYENRELQCAPFS